MCFASVEPAGSRSNLVCADTAAAVSTGGLCEEPGAVPESRLALLTAFPATFPGMSRLFEVAYASAGRVGENLRGGNFPGVSGRLGILIVSRGLDALAEDVGAWAGVDGAECREGFEGVAELGSAGISAATTGSVATILASTTSFAHTVLATAFSVAITGATTTRSGILRISASLNCAAAINTISE